MTEQKRPAGKRERGRPSYVPTDETREKVRVLRAQGMSKEAIAVSLDISFDTLVKYFSLDLECAVAKATADVMMARYRAAVGGSVPAQNKFLELAGALPQRPAKAPKLGKKEQALQDAQQPDRESKLGDLIARRMN